MAAPPPYWKKKTRPCPFYSAGRCLFSDSCNFVHSVKVNHEPQTVLASTAPPEGTHYDYTRVIDRSDVGFKKSIELNGERWSADERPGANSSVSAGSSLSRSTSMSSNSSSRGTLRRSSSERRRRSIMSPPRSPRLSGLLSVLEPVIGPEPELEEFDEEDEEDEEDEGGEGEGEGGEEGESCEPVTTDSSFSKPEFKSPHISTTSRYSTALPYLQETPTSTNEDLDATSPPLVYNSGPSTSSLELTTESTSTERPSNSSLNRARIPAPIITQSYGPTSIVLDNNTLEVHTQRPQSLLFIDDPLTTSRGSRPPSTFELLTSPFAGASPALRILSPQLQAGEPIAPIFSALHGLATGPTPRSRPYADDDVDSLETLESSEENSENAIESSSSHGTDESRDCSEESFEFVEKDDELGSENSESVERVDSPHETERPVSDDFRTPRNKPNTVEAMRSDQEVPSLPSPRIQKGGTEEGCSQERISVEGEDDSVKTLTSPVQLIQETSVLSPSPARVDRSLSHTEIESHPPTELEPHPPIENGSHSLTGIECLASTETECLSSIETEFLPPTETGSLYPTEIESPPPTEIESCPPIETEPHPLTEIESLPSSKAESLPLTVTESLSPTEIESHPPTDIEYRPLTETRSSTPIETGLLPATEIESLPATEVDSLNATDIVSLPPIEIEFHPPFEIAPSPTTETEPLRPTGIEPHPPIEIDSSPNRIESSLPKEIGPVLPSETVASPTESQQESNAVETEEISDVQPSSPVVATTLLTDAILQEDNPPVFGETSVEDHIDSVLDTLLRDSSSETLSQNLSSDNWSRDSPLESLPRDCLPRDLSPENFLQDPPPEGLPQDSYSGNSPQDASAENFIRDSSPEIFPQDSSPEILPQASSLENYLQDSSPENVPQEEVHQDLNKRPSLEYVNVSTVSPLISERRMYRENSIDLSSPRTPAVSYSASRKESLVSSVISSPTYSIRRSKRAESVVSNKDQPVTAPVLRLSPTEGLTKIVTSGEDTRDSDSSTTNSLDPSPIFSEQSSEHTHDTSIESNDDENLNKGNPRETILERRTRNSISSPRRLAVKSVTSPTKLLREILAPSPVERTIRPSPSPLYGDSFHSASPSTSSAASSPRPSWAELQKRSGVSHKVPFGFRQSLLVDESQSTTLAKRLSAHSMNDSTGSLASSLANLTPNPRPASRVDMLAGRARSVSPAGFTSGSSSKRDSLASIASSNSSFQRVHANPPRSASQLEFNSHHLRSDSPISVAGSESSSSRQSWMKPLRLSHNVNSAASSLSDRRSSAIFSQTKRSSIASIHSSTSHDHHASSGSLVDNSLLSSSRSSLISAYLNDTDIPPHDNSSVINSDGSQRPSLDSVLPSSSTQNSDTPLDGDLLSPLSGSMRGLDFEELSGFQFSEIDPDATADEPSIPPLHVSSEEHVDSVDQPAPTKLSPVVEAENLHPSVKLSPAKSSPPNSQIPTPIHAIATPRPTLMFAIASDNPAEVERVLASGEAHTNDAIGPQSALEFALTNDALVNKTEIVKTLLAFGADPSSLSGDLLKSHTSQSQQENTEIPPEEEDDVLTGLPSEAVGSISKRKKRESLLNPAMKYYLNRANAGAQGLQTNAALRKSDFRPLARMRFDFVGQDRALEHLYWVLGMHSQQPIGTPLVVLCCGPSGHGKSLLARKFGSLLDVPTHTVNMTVLKTSHDLWDCPSMSPYDPPSQRTLAEFLEENAGKRCVVVLDEIDKNEDERTLWSLLAPWELGRCSIDAGRRHIDVRNVIWLGTSNLGQNLVFEHHKARKEPDTIMTKAEYRGLMNNMRPLVTERLGPSLMSRVTAVLPFVPFTPEEKLAIASEAVLALGGDMATELGPEEFEQLASQCVSEYVSTDGARSLYRSVSTHLMEAF